MLRDDYEKLKLSVQDMLTDMEYHHMTDEPEVFDKWWRESGREMRYFELQERRDRLSVLVNTDPDDLWSFS